MPFGCCAPGIVAVDTHLAQIGSQMPGRQAQQRALARSISPDQAGDPRAQLQRDLIDADDRPVPLRHAVEQKDRRRAREVVRW